MTADVSNIVSEEALIASPKSSELSKTHEGELAPKVFLPLSFSPEGEPNISPMDTLHIISWVQRQKCKHIAKELQERLLPAGQPEKHLPRYFKRALQGFKADVKSANDDILEIGQILGVSKENIKPLLINRDAILAEEQAALF